MEEPEAVGATVDTEDPGTGVALDDLVEASRGELARAAIPPMGLAGESLLVGECVEAKHPTLRGRVRVRWEDTSGNPTERWLPTLYRLPVREADRVLLARPANWNESVVIGVLDGFARRPEVPNREGASLELSTDECLRVRSVDGSELVEIRQEREGPVVRLLQPDVDLELPGTFRLGAREIRLEARQGRAEVKATDDVVVRGEVIRLN